METVLLRHVGEKCCLIILRENRQEGVSVRSDIVIELTGDHGVSAFPRRTAVGVERGIVGLDAAHFKVHNETFL